MASKKRCARTTMRGEGDKRSFLHRIHRLQGQLSGVAKMIEENRYCDDILVQLAALDKGIKSLSSLLLEKHLHTCLVEDVKKGDLSALDEVSNLFKKFN